MRERARGEPDGGLRRRLHKLVRRVHWQAMELGVMGAGCPDTNGCADGVDFWIECKHISAEDGLVPLMPEQIGWILRRMRAGGRVFVATWVEHEGGVRKGDAVSRLVLHEGWDAAEIRSGGLGAAPPVAVFEGGPTRWDGEEIRQLLTTWVFSVRVASATLPDSEPCIAHDEGGD